MNILGFFAGLPGKLWGYVTVVAGMLAALAYFYFSTKEKGKVEAETKAKVKEAQAGEARAKVVTESVVADAKIVAEIKKEIDALPPSDIADRARKWVRNKPPGN